LSNKSIIYNSENIPFVKDDLGNQQVFAEVVIDIPHPSLDRIFEYRVPCDLMENIHVGARVLVPFGLKNKQMDGFVLKIKDRCDFASTKIKDIISCFDDDFVLLEELIPIVKWMRGVYHCTYIDAIRCFVPPSARKVKSSRYIETVRLTASFDEAEAFIKSNIRRASAMCKILFLLLENPEMTKEDIFLNTWASPATFKSLQNKGFIEIIKEEHFRIPEVASNLTRSSITLTPQQNEVIERCTEEYNKEKKKPVLIRGVTGSGKTEVYMRIAKRVIDSGKRVIMLVPEIALTPQTVANFKSFFKDDIAVLNSRLSAGERYDEWRRIKNGIAKIVIGARSAIFAPITNLGLVIIDEEHEDSYKSEISPRYNAIDVAQKRCEASNALLILGSATPDIVHYNKACKGEYVKLVMPERIGSGFPDITVCDMKRELELGNKTMFSTPLYNAIKALKNTDDQGILMLNRRGYAEHVSCRKCGFVYKCDHCNVSLTYHQKKGLLKCHHCGYAVYMKDTCPVCGSKYIKVFGRGTQRLEDEIRKYFPEVPFIRMDADTTTAKGAHFKILNAFSEGKYKLLLGTQMVSKGLDFKNVSLVGIIAPDSTLNMPEYKSAERVFRLISQASGRAGRGDKPGKVILQCYNPEHYAIQCAIENDYDKFYFNELRERQQGLYPPFCRIMRIVFSSHNEEDARTEAQNAAQTILALANEENEAGILDVLCQSAPIERLRDRFRWHVIVKFNDDAEYTVHRAADIILDDNNYSKVQASIDFDPVSIL